MTKAEWRQGYHDYRLYNRLARSYFAAERAHRKRPIRYKDLAAIRERAMATGRYMDFGEANMWGHRGNLNGRGVYIWKTLPTKAHADETFVYYPHVYGGDREFVRISGKEFIRRRRIYAAGPR